jgi:5-methylcytosine-specific restriction endonuclease McrA
LLSENEGSFYRNRRIVLERDNYTCQYCGFKGESNYMDVHHIIKVRESGPSLPENMITLCRKCHNNADRGYISIEFLQEKVMV